MNLRPKRFNIAMALTWSRIAFIPLIVAIFYLPDSWFGSHFKNVFACAMFSIAAVTDALDGYFARNWNMSSVKGAFLDAVADKLIVCSAIIVLLFSGRIPMLVALIIIGREIAVTALREWMARIRAERLVRVNAYGKVKTIAQMVAIGMLLFYDPFCGVDIGYWGTLLIYVACALTLYSMVVYLLAAWPHIEAQDDVAVPVSNAAPIQQTVTTKLEKKEPAQKTVRTKSVASKSTVKPPKTTVSKTARKSTRK